MAADILPLQIQTVPPEVRAALRADMPGIAVGAVITVVGLSAIVVHFLRLKSSDRSLLWFGLVGGLYGIRLLISLQTIRLLFDAPLSFWLYPWGIINDVIIVPVLLFYEALYGKGWKSSLRGLLWFQTLYSAAAILVGILAGNPFLAPDPGAFLLVLLPAVLILGYLKGYRPPPIATSRPVQIGFLTFAAFVLNEHLVIGGVVPWRWRAEPLGFLVLICCFGYVAAQRFFANEQQLVAIERELQAARRIQASILPSVAPKTAGLEIAVRYLPMTAVAGDFYDFLQDGEERLGILVADVAGHGVPAALIASMVKVAVSLQASKAAEPVEVISGLNRVLCQQSQGQFATAGYLYLDVSRRRAAYSGAGHPSLLRWRKSDQTLAEYQANGMLLGFQPNAEYTHANIEIQPGDRLLLYTDGVIEAENVSEEPFGENRLKQFIRSHQHLPVEGFADSLLRELSAWSAAGKAKPQTDDLTLLVVDVEGYVGH